MRKVVYLSVSLHDVGQVSVLEKYHRSTRIGRDAVLLQKVNILAAERVGWQKGQPLEIDRLRIDQRPFGEYERTFRIGFHFFVQRRQHDRAG